MQYDGDLISECIEIILAHVLTSHLHAPLAHVVETGNKVDERGLARTRTADNADRLARSDMQIDIFQDVLFGVCGILKRDVLKVDRAVRDLVNGIFGIVKRTFLFQDFTDTTCTFHTHNDHNKYHGKHHERH